MLNIRIKVNNLTKSAIERCQCLFLLEKEGYQSVLSSLKLVGGFNDFLERAI